MRLVIKAIMIMAVMSLGACGGASKAATASESAPAQEAAPKVQAPTFCADSAFAFVAKQVEMGPRVPGSAASAACADWLLSKLTEYGAENVIAQRGEVTAYTGTKLPICNISAQYNPAAKRRIMLVAHWDTRPWADQEPNPADRERPIDGANDGASGVGVILEIARLLAQQQPRVGVDILLVDAEDYGRRADHPDAADDADTWALGTQYWIQNPTLDINKIDYAILLDLVGGKQAEFPREQFSEVIARRINDKIWKEAATAGYGRQFPNTVGGAIVDDHVYLARIGIKAVDIIENANPKTGSFPPTWHTHADNIDNIEPATLGAVGQVVTNVIYKE